MMPISPSLWLSALSVSLLALPLNAAAATLTLPSDARIGVEVIDTLNLSASTPEHNDILLHPAQVAGTSHTLPDYCVLVANARFEDQRVRITTQDVTCIETTSSESEIFSGEISAAAYGEDGSYGLPCGDDGCALKPGQGFLLHLSEEVTIEAQENVSAKINQERRQADGTGVANPIPADSPSPDTATEALDDPDAE
ncbi:hypothetical protein VRRI112168_06365 [Vreelandella rituensis]|uniref:Uncharacterized protein n=1 Tax=Vreelandella rituensis TaxID=2282306 RepID=A0A368U6P7_9GAMM|nr:hypothetical protein [Halomonas rituensis]RCV92624.1 hypothetical protein DU506_07105 [Halomonas rituensis]